MCTVTAVPGVGGLVLTASRDESPLRTPALAPQIIDQAGQRLIYPVDGAKGGTWAAAKDNGDAMILLNGAFVKHVVKSGYRLSRGVIFLHIFRSPSPWQAFLEMELADIEPFTLVVWADGLLFDCRWDGAQKTLDQVDSSMPHMWSSVTLYEPSVAAQRQAWLNSWLLQHPQPTQQQMMGFHSLGGNGDEENNLCMRRGNNYCTVSITSFLLTATSVNVQYLAMPETTDVALEVVLPLRSRVTKSAAGSAQF